jgi:chromate transport protein ChrA
VTDLSGSSASTTERPSLGEVAAVFTRYGNFTLGGGSATSAVLHGQIVTRRHWVTARAPASLGSDPNSLGA